MNILLPGNFADIIRKQRTTMLRVPPSEPDRILLASRQYRMIVEIAVEQTRLTSILVHFKNVDASTLW